MNRTLSNFLERCSGCSLEDLIAAEVPIKPEVILQLDGYLYGVNKVVAETSLCHPEINPDFKAVSFCIHLAEDAFDRVGAYGRLSFLYCLWLTRLYDKEVPFTIEKAIIDRKETHLTYYMMFAGHKWSQKALDYMKDRPGYGSTYNKIVAERTMSYYEVLEHFFKNEQCLRSEINVSSEMYGYLSREGILVSLWGDRLAITEKGWMGALSYQNFLRNKKR